MSFGSVELTHTITPIWGPGESATHRSPQPAPATPTSPAPAKVTIQWAQHLDEVREAQRLRYQVFANEWGAHMASALPGHDIDVFDDYCEHLLVAPFIKAFGIRYPGLRVELLDVAEQDVERQVLEEKADIGIGTHTHEDPEITARPLFCDTYQAVLPSGHRLVSSRHVSWRLLVKSLGSPCRRSIPSAVRSTLT
jgi:DNA-binding transcriptional LysR family regulator